MKKPKKSETWDDCRPDFENKTYTRAEIMKLWDVWADHIEKWGKDTWPKKEFEFIVDSYEARIKTMKATRLKLTSLLKVADSILESEMLNR